MKPSQYVKQFRVTDGPNFRLKDFDPAETLGLKSKEHAQETLEHGIARLCDLQEKLYAQDRWAILVVLQAMDAAGKDSTIKHVMSGLNPQGCSVSSFKEPSTEELNHDFLWRAAHALPERGRIGIFNRSYYEEVLVVRVHPEILSRERIPGVLVKKTIWRERFEDIAAFERYLARNGTVVVKFFLNVSKEEQRQRFLDRLEEPSKNWKFSMDDVAERALWDKYHAAYQELVRHTSTAAAPWHVVPADHKWFARVVIGSTIVSALDRLDLRFPKVDAASLQEFKKVREALLAEGQGAKKAVKTPVKQVK